MNIFIYLYLFFLLIRAQDWVPGLVGFPSATTIIPLGLLVGYTQYSKNTEDYKTPLNYLIILYLIHIFLSTTYNVGGSAGFHQFVEYLKRILLFYMVIWIVTDEVRFKKVLNVWLILTLFIVYQMQLQMYSGQSWGGMTVFPGYEGTRVRWYGLWDGPNVLGIIFVIASCIAFERFIGYKGIYNKIIYSSMFLTFFLGIYLTNSRGAVLAVGAAILFSIRRFLLNVKLLAVFGVVLVVALSFLPPRLTEVNSEEESAHERTWLWETGLNMADHSPIFGVGRGEFIHNNTLLLVAHNNFVQNLGELGYPGFFLFIAIIWFSFKGNYIIGQKKYSISDEALLNNRIMNTILVAFSAVTFFVLMEHDLIFFLFGMCIAAFLIARKQDSSIPPLEFTKLDFKMIIIGMFTIYFMIWLAAVKEII